ncbi:diadenylate cyclase [Tessaracoccus lubricantis]|uniref:Diadenylate cyclase n=1 Tax=Tessaracoccus lubricantis TaxID=545543 RepID=A0ABP9FAA5_9ACTN
MVWQLWEGQARFRRSLEQVANDVLDAAGVDIDPRAFLVALPISPDGDVLVEPQRGHFDRTILKQASTLATRRLNKLVRDGELDDDSQAHLAALESRTRRRVVADKLDAAARATGRVHFVGLGVRIGEHLAFPVLALHADPWQELPQLPDDADDAFLTARSFQEAVVTTVLDVASRELDRQSPGQVVRADTEAVLRAAADSFVSAVVARTGQDHAFGAMQAFDAVAATRYEGRAGKGTLVLAPAADDTVTRIITLEHPVPIGRTRGLRKILELSGPGLHLLCDGREVYGLGTFDNGARGHTFGVRISGDGSWELWDDDVPFLRVDNGIPVMPRDLLDEDEFAITVERVFPNVSARNARILWRVAVACSQQAHGTMLVVHPEADREAARLLPQAYAITPTRLSDRALEAATSIDGAVLVSPDGRCHAVGVILDGLATGTGDPARGARFSSAIRYLAGAGKGAMVIIVSEDGRIDLLPKSKRRVRRATVQRAVDRLVTTAAEGEDPEAFTRADRAVEKIEFYLNQEQCDAVNAAREAVESREWGEARVRRQYIPIAPDPAMDDSYFVDRATLNDEE